MKSRPSGILISVLATALTVPVLAIGAPTAHARSWTHDDGTGDVWQYYYDDDYHPAPSQGEGDITRVRLNHNRRYVQLFMTLRDNNASTARSYYYFEVQNGRRWVREVEVFHAAGSSPDTILRIHKGPATSALVGCRGMKRATINWTTHTVAATIPRACFGHPKYLRVSAYDYLSYSGREDLFTDDAQSARMHYPFGGYQKWSPWVKRG
jgi:hypothetical protein